jgi:hypothetical protein
MLLHEFWDIGHAETSQIFCEGTEVFQVFRERFLLQKQIKMRFILISAQWSSSIRNPPELPRLAHE